MVSHNSNVITACHNIIFLYWCTNLHIMCTKHQYKNVMEAFPRGTAQFSNDLCKVTYSITMDVENTINC